MKLNKTEEKILNSNFARKSKILLVAGILFIIASISMLFVEPVLVERARAPFVQVVQNANSITARTESEVALKGMVIGSIGAAEAGWVANAKAKSQNIFTFFLLLGSAFISSSVLLKKCHILAQIKITPNN